MGKFYGSGFLKKNGLVYAVSKKSNAKTEFLIIDYWTEDSDNPQRDIITKLSQQMKKEGYEPADEINSDHPKRMKELIEWAIAHIGVNS